MIARVLIAAVSCGIFVAQLSRGRAADAESRYSEPDFSKRLFNPDALSLEGDEREAIVSALAALVGPLPGAENVENLLRMKALAIALRLDNMHARARQANDALIAGQTPERVESVHETAGGIAEFLMTEALRLRESGGEEEDALLYPHLMEIARTVEPGKWEEESGGSGASPGRTAAVVGEPLPSGGAAGSMAEKNSEPAGTGEPATPVVEFKRSETALRVVVFGRRGEGAVPCLLKVSVSDDEEVSEGDRYYSEAGIRPVVMTQLRAAVRLLEDRHSASLRGRFRFELTALDKERVLPLGEPRLGVTLLFLLDSLVTGAALDGDISLGGALPSANSRTRPRGRWGEILRAAGRGGAKVLVVSPSAESDLTDMLVSGEIAPLLLVQAIELVEPAAVSSFLSMDRNPNAAKALSLFDELRPLLSRYEPAELVANSKVRERLREVLDLFPDHLSARLLLEHGSGSLAERMSLRGSVGRVDALLEPVRGLRAQTESSTVTSSQDERCADCLFALRRIRPSLAEGAISYCDASVDLLVLMREYLKLSNRSTKRARDLAAEIGSAVSRVENLRTGLGKVLESP